MDRILFQKENRESFKDYNHILRGFDLGIKKDFSNENYKYDARRHLKKVYGQYINID